VLSLLAEDSKIILQMNEEVPKHDPLLLLKLIEMKMPFGKYKDTILCDLPIAYLSWFQRKGYPKGKLGMLLHTMYEIKMNGLDYLLIPLRENKSKAL
jgi:uncharacterized protein (DUF3820 family)